MAVYDFIRLRSSLKTAANQTNYAKY
jgi:hypothetical protein